MVFFVYFFDFKKLYQFLIFSCLYTLKKLFRKNFEKVIETHVRTYSYSNDGRISGYTISGDFTSNTIYNYDVLDRLSSVVYNNIEGKYSFTISKSYSYLLNSPTCGETSLVEAFTSTVGDTTVTHTYTYDDAGNMYGYVLYEENADGSLGEDISPNISHSYFNSEWGDLLTAFNGTAITYDEIGNPLSYYNGSSYTFGWEGRELISAVKGTNSMSFAYNDAGLRISKTVNGVTTHYVYDGDILVAEYTDSETIVYIYDAYDSPIGFKYRSNSYAADTWDVYWYGKNIQGDIVAVYSSTGTVLMNYTYTAWGKTEISYYHSGASTTAVRNNLTYRGYYYDSDIGMYYLQSRYYDPAIGRWINADGELSDVGGDIRGYNLFAYCFNNPVNMDDPSGNWPKWLSGALNVVGGTLQIAAGAALGATVGWTGFGAVAAGFLILNGTATATQGTGQIVNYVTNSSVMREDNIIREGVQEVGRAIGGEIGAKISGGAYDVAVIAANLYAGKVGLQQAGKLPIKVNINNVVNNPLDEFVTVGPADGVIQQYCRTIPQSGYGKIYVTQLGNGLYQIANGHHRVAALRALGYETIKVFLTR